MDIPHLATILSSTFDPNLREEAEKKLNEVRVSNLNCSFRKSIFLLYAYLSSDICEELNFIASIKKSVLILRIIVKLAHTLTQFSDPENSCKSETKS